MLRLLGRLAAPPEGFAALYVDRVTRRLRVALTGETLDIEHTGRRGQANGYASLDSTGKVPAAQLPAASGGGLATPAASGLVAVDTGTGTTYGRTIAGTSPVTVTNGDGVSGNPTIAVNAATTSAAGIVELATDGETASGVAVQGNDSRLSNSRAPSGAAGGDLGGAYPNPTVTQARGLRETAGPTTLSMGAVSDGQYLKRSGSSIVGDAGTSTPTAHASSHQDGGSDEVGTATPAAAAIPKADEWGGLHLWGFNPHSWVGWVARASGVAFQWMGDSGFASTGTTTVGNTLYQTVWTLSGVTNATLRCANQDVRRGVNVLVEGCFVTGTSLASTRIWSGCMSTVGTGATPSGAGAGLNFDQALSGNVQAFSYDGTTISRTDTGVTLATSTVYRYQVYLTDTAVKVRIWVAGGSVPAWTTHTTNLPGAAVNLYAGILVFLNTALGTKTLGVVSVGARWKLNDA